MRTSRFIILWTMITFAAVPLGGQVLGGRDGAVCYVSSNETRVRFGFENEKCASPFYQKLWGTGNCTVRKPEVYSPVKKTCCDGYENKSSICVPRCSPKCQKGECEEPNTCICSNSWGGKTCNESLWCYVKGNSTETLSELSVEGGTENAPLKSMRPACLPKCRGIKSSSLIDDPSGETFYFIPIETPCNIETDFANFSETYKYSIAGSLGAVLLAVMIFCVICVARRKEKPSGIMDEEITEYEYDYVYDHRL